MCLENSYADSGTRTAINDTEMSTRSSSDVQACMPASLVSTLTVADCPMAGHCVALQVEGAFVQGIGMWTCEEVVYDEATGALITDSSW